MDNSAMHEGNGINAVGQTNKEPTSERTLNDSDRQAGTTASTASSLPLYPLTHQAEFLRTLFSRKDRALVELRLLPEPEGDGALTDFYDSTERLIDALPKTIEDQKGCGVFVGVCPRSQRDGKKASIKRVYCLWADLDGKDFQGGKDEALERLRMFPLSPTLFIDSGRGCHGYWVLKEPFTVQGEADIDRIEGYTRRLAVALGGDLKATDLARVLRVPGSFNLKDPTNPLPVHIVELETDREYTLADFDRCLLPQPGSTAVGRSNPPGWLPEALEGLGEGNRHDSFKRIIGKLHWGGLTQDEIIALLTPHYERVAHDGHTFSYEEFSRLVTDLCRLPRNITASQPLYGSEPVKFTPIPLGEMEEPEERVDVVMGFIPEGYPTVLYGDGGQGKSYLAQVLATCVALGRPFLGLPVRGTNVLYLDWELDQEEMTRRGYRIARGMSLEQPPKNLWYLKVEQPFAVLLEHIKTFVRAQGVGFVVVDSLGAACGDDPELARFVIPLFGKLRSLGVTVLIVDHQSKLQHGQSYDLKTPFGSIYKYNLARSVFQLQRVGSKPGQLYVTFRQTKCNFGPLSDPIAISLSFEERAVRVIRVDPKTEALFYEHLNAEEKIMMSIRENGPATNKTLADRTGIHERTVANTTARLKKEGMLKEVGKVGHAIVYGLVDFDHSGSQEDRNPLDGLDV